MKMFLSPAFVLLICAVIMPADPTPAGEYYDKAMNYWNNGDFNSAANAFNIEIEENPGNADALFNLGIMYEKLQQYGSAATVWNEYLRKGGTNDYKRLAKKHYDALSARKPPISQNVEIRINRLNPIFCSLYKFYSEHPFAKACVSNNRNSTVKNVKLTFFVNKYMDYPQTVKVADSIDPWSFAYAEIKAVINENALTVTEDIPNVQAEIILSYDSDSGAENVKTVKNVSLYNRNALTWDNPEKLSSFVTLKDPLIIDISRTAYQEFHEAKPYFINDKIFKAMVIFNVIGDYNVTYQEDPVTPFKKLSSVKDAVDFVQYPRETLKRKTGDCDDCAILYSSMLESMGIETAFVVLPTHVFMVFETGLTPEEVRSYSANIKPIEIEGRIWMPVETTMYRKSFFSAVANAMMEYLGTDTSQIQIVRVRKSWETFYPVSLPDEKINVEKSGSNAKSLLASDVEEFKKWKIASISDKLKLYEDALNQNPSNVSILNKAGVLYGENGFYAEASEYFLKAEKINPNNFRIYVNLGNVYRIMNKPEEAAKHYAKSIELDPTEQSGYANMVMLNIELGRIDEAAELLKKLSAIDADSAEKLGRYVKMDASKADSKTKADEIKREVQWAK